MRKQSTILIYRVHRQTTSRTDGLWLQPVIQAQMLVSESLENLQGCQEKIIHGTMTKKLYM